MGTGIGTWIPLGNQFLLKISPENKKQNEVVFFAETTFVDSMDDGALEMNLSMRCIPISGENSIV